MFIGHYAPAMLAAAHPKSPGLGPLMIAGQLVDIAFMGFVIAGIEHMRIVPGITVMTPMDLYHMPYTHSLIGGIAWGAAFAFVIYALTRNRTGALLGAAVVVSHWILDFLVHRPDLTIAGTPPKLGLGLWDYPLVEMPLEIALISAGFAYYLVQTRPKPGTSRAALYVMIGAMALFQAFNWFAPQPETYDISFPLLGLFAYAVFIALGFWLGSTRVHKSVQSAA